MFSMRNKIISLNYSHEKRTNASVKVLLVSFCDVQKSANMLILHKLCFTMTSKTVPKCSILKRYLKAGAHIDQGPVVQSIVSLTSPLRGQLVKCFTALFPNTLIFFVEKNERSFCTAKASYIFSTKNIGVFEIYKFEFLTKR